MTRTVSFRDQIHAMQDRSRGAAPDSVLLEYKKTNRFVEMCKQFARNPTGMIGLVLMILLILMAVLAPVLAPEGFDAQNLREGFLAPSAEHLFGTDNLGRDILARCIWGARYSLSCGVIAVLISMLIGGVLGLIAGYYGGASDSVIMRFLDIFMSIPPVLLALAIVAALGSGLTNLMLSIALGNAPMFARVVRGSVMSVKEEEFTEAARCTGCSDGRIMLKYILPNCLSPLIVQRTLGVANAILCCSLMSFVGLGLQPPIPEWGAILSTGRTYIRQAWWFCTFPGIMIAITVLAFNFFGDGIRDAMDPKLKR